MKKYLVVHDLKHFSGISIERDPDRTFPHPIEVWAIDSGDRVDKLLLRVPRRLSQFHVGGTFEEMARYGLDFDELVMLIGEYFGPSDRERYEAMTHGRRTSNAAFIGTTMIAEGGWAFGRIFWYTLKCMALLITLPIALLLKKR